MLANLRRSIIPNRQMTTLVASCFILTTEAVSYARPPIFEQVTLDAQAIADVRNRGDINGGGQTNVVMEPHPGYGTDCSNCLIAYLAPK